MNISLPILGGHVIMGNDAPASMGQRLFSTIESEYRLSTQSVCAITQQRELLESNYVLQHSIRQRNPYVDPISLLQARLLKQRREHPSPQTHALLERALAMTISGIAAGMRHTG